MLGRPKPSDAGGALRQRHGHRIQHPGHAQQPYSAGRIAHDIQQRNRLDRQQWQRAAEHCLDRCRSGILLYIETATCNAGAFPIVIAAGGNACVVTVTFSPIAATTPGPVPGTLTITQTGGTVTTVPLSGPAWDFSVSAAAITVAKGATGTFPVLVTGLGGFTGAVSFTCTPAMLITSCSVPTTNAAPAPGATAMGSITAASFIVPPQSLKAPPSALLRQVLFIMMAIALLFMIPAARRFRTRLGMAGAMMVFILVAGCSGSGTVVKGFNHRDYAVFGNRHQTSDHGECNHHAIKINATAVQAARSCYTGRAALFSRSAVPPRTSPTLGASLFPRDTGSLANQTIFVFQMIFGQHYTLRGFPSILVSRRVPTYYRPPASENSHNERIWIRSHYWRTRLMKLIKR